MQYNVKRIMINVAGGLEIGRPDSYKKIICHGPLKANFCNDTCGLFGNIEDYYTRHGQKFKLQLCDHVLISDNFADNRR